ncbi:PorT family protein [Pseudoflavitalea sp. G-6-1-2]|uniref:porin family protein n=1 Tax=Pseudoflavitalea sp. G-6-1-2 TaxID=2728841 RepID=UPI00146EAA8C|nr:porin family protein [Pseudoflavitalea sp. G-6-1-2]NML21010.1 PorT family protein [Pseudoflavitalea sp. G-6-1-2]
MPLLNDNELDRLSREAADQYDVEVGTSGWEAVQQRLDEELPRKRRRGFFFWWLLAGMLLLGGGWFIINKQTTSDNSEPIAKTTLPANRQAHQSTQKDTAAGMRQQLIAEDEHTSNSSEVKKDDNKKSAAGSGPENVAQKQMVNDRFKSNNDQSANNEERITGRRITEKQVADKMHLSNKRSNLISGRSKSSENNLLQIPTTVILDKSADVSAKEAEQQAGNQSKQTLTQPQSAQQEISESDTSLQNILPNQQLQATDSNAIPHPTPEQPATRTTANKKPLNTTPSGRKKSFSVTLFVGPDISNVKFSSMGKFGLMAGVQANYYFAERWSISTGISFTKKYYKARPKDFTPKGAMVYYNIEAIEGNCAMWDIPINLRYDFSVKPNSRAFVSAGISSYLMTSENYDYYYLYNGYRASKNWNTDSNSNYLFSVLNLSAGKEWQIGKKLFFQAEPYLKIPVKGIGNGDIQLNSYGIIFGLKYQFGKK